MAENLVTKIGIGVKADTKTATRNINALVDAIKKLQGTTSVGIGGDFLVSLVRISSAFETLAQFKANDIISSSVAKRFNELNDAINGFNTEKFKEIADSVKTIGLANVVSGGLQLPDAERYFSNLESALDRSVAPAFNDVTKEAEEATDAIEKQEEEVEKSQSVWARLSSAISGTTLRFGNFLAALKRIAIYRAIRFVLKEITQSFREGVQNMYQYSLLINGRFKDSMDTLSTSALYLKNSLGALAAPLINAIAPAIERVVDGFVDFTNVIAELIAMISGQETWSKALKYPKAYADQMEGAAGAAKELRATLLGFDEINRLDDNSKGGRGRVGDLMDYSKMFEEVTTRSLADFWDDILHSGEGKFALFAAGVAGVLALKLSGALGGVFATSKAAALGGQFAAAFLAAFAGYRLGNWIYESDFFGVKGSVDKMMDNWLGPLIDDIGAAFSRTWKGIKEDGLGVWESVKQGFGPLTETIKENWGIMIEYLPDIGQKIYDSAEEGWNKFRKWWHENNVLDTKVVVESDNWAEENKGFIDAVQDAMAHAAGDGISEGLEKAMLPYLSPNSDLYAKIDEAANKRKSTTLLNTASKQAQSIISSLGNIKLFAGGGTPETGSLFLANEGGVPELIGQVGHKTHVANNEQITESIKVATMEGNAESNGLLRQAVSILNGILQKDNVVVANVTTDSITSGLDRQNRRNGRTTVPVGV